MQTTTVSHSNGSGSDIGLFSTQHRKLWFEDGNIVLVACNAVAFRVYKGLLSRASPVFRDIFAIGQDDAPGAEKVDGCVAVHVTEFPEDLRAFLKMIFDMPPHALTGNIPVSYRTLAGIIRCAHKYQADAALDAAGTRLLRILYSRPFAAPLFITPPDTMQQAWKMLTNEYAIPDVELTDANEIVSLLRLMDPDVKDTRSLSRALYLCTVCDPIALRNGVLRQGTKVVFKLSDDDHVLCSTATYELSQEMRRIYQLACESLIENLKRPKQQGSAPRTLFSPPECTAAENGCRDLIAHIASEHNQQQTYHPLSTLLVEAALKSSPPMALSRTSNLCSSCLSTFRSPLDSQRQKIIINLPTYFSLPPSSELNGTPPANAGSSVDLWR